MNTSDLLYNLFYELYIYEMQSTDIWILRYSVNNVFLGLYSKELNTSSVSRDKFKPYIVYTIK